eukprot:EG_transcript_33392
MLAPRRLLPHCLPAARALSTAPPVDSNKTRVYVGNVPLDASREKIRKHFQTAGKVRDVKMVTQEERLETSSDRKKLPVHFAFIEFEDPEAAERAAKALNQTMHRGRVMVVREAQN